MVQYKDYPTFKRGELLKEYSKLPITEREIIDNFIRYVSITSSSKQRLGNNKRNITHLRTITGKELDKITLQDLRDFLGLLNNSKMTMASQTEMKASIKRFLRWYYKDWSIRFDELRDIKLRFGMNEKKINASTILQEGELKLLMDKETRLLWKTFLITLYESGLRPKELRTLTWDKVDLHSDLQNKDISSLNIFATKTNKARTSYVKEATYYLEKLKNERDKNTPLVFPSPKDNQKPCGKDLVYVWLNRLSLKTLKREITPYMLRHGRAKELYLDPNVPDEVVQKFLGHSKDMRSIYTRLSNQDVKEASSKFIYSFEDLPPEKKLKLEEQIDLNNKKVEILTKKIETLQENYNKLFNQ